MQYFMINSTPSTLYSRNLYILMDLIVSHVTPTMTAGIYLRLYEVIQVADLSGLGRLTATWECVRIRIERLWRLWITYGLLSKLIGLRCEGEGLGLALSHTRIEPEAGPLQQDCSLYRVASGLPCRFAENIKQDDMFGTTKTVNPNRYHMKDDRRSRTWPA